MEQPIDLLALSLLAAVSVTVGLTAAGYGHGPGQAQPGAGGNLADIVAAVLGLDPGQVQDYVTRRGSGDCGVPPAGPSA